MSFVLSITSTARSFLYLKNNERMIKQKEKRDGIWVGHSASYACLSLAHEVRTLQRRRLMLSALFRNIKAGFDNINASTLRALILAKGTPDYMVD